MQAPETGAPVGSASPPQRDVFSLAAAGVAADGALGLAWPLLRSLAPATDVLAEVVLEMDLAPHPRGQRRHRPLAGQARIPAPAHRDRVRPRPRRATSRSPTPSTAQIRSASDSRPLLALLPLLAADPPPAPALAAGAASDPLPALEPALRDRPLRPDDAARRRGLEAFQQACAACHGLRHLPYRKIGRLGLTAEQIRAIAAERPLPAIDADGQPTKRPATASDPCPPWPNEAAGRAQHNGALPPDLSLITKARHSGAAYVAALLHRRHRKHPGLRRARRLGLPRLGRRARRRRPPAPRWPRPRLPRPRLPPRPRDPDPEPPPHPMAPIPRSA